jgi:hypothetical protein
VFTATFHPQWTLWPLSLLIGCGYGLVLGGAVGFFSGLTLALTGAYPAASDGKAHAVGAVSASVPFLIAALTFSVLGPRAALYLVSIALISGTAGGLLAPRVVRGRDNAHEGHEDQELTVPPQRS